MSSAIKFQCMPEKESDLRVHDLIAKSSHVSLKNTVKVLRTLQSISSFMGKPIEELLESSDLSLRKANDAEYHACEEAYRGFEQYLRKHGAEDLLENIRAMEFDQ